MPKRSTDLGNPGLWGPRPRRYKPAPLLGKLILLAAFGVLLALGAASCLAKL
jgi:hypothetical protein